MYYGSVGGGSKIVKTRKQYESYGYIVKRMVFTDFASPILWFIPLDNIEKRNTKGYLPIFHGRGSKDVQVSFYFLINTSQLEISTGG